MSGTLPPAVGEYLRAHHVMTLATCGADGPWAAAVFYANDGDSLVFLSAPTTRHCRNLAGDARCAATIQDDCADWKGIRGIQMEGRVSELQGDEAGAARRVYGVKFPLVAEAAGMPPAIREALARISWFRLVPERVYFIDNGKGFGHRDQFDLGPG